MRVEGSLQRADPAGATRPAIIMPAVPFASQADRERALSVMRLIMTECFRDGQIAEKVPRDV